VPHDRRRLVSERVQQSDDIADHVELGVLIDAFRFVGLAVAPLVRRHNVVAGFREAAELMPPGIPGLRKAVAENDERPLPASAMCIVDPLVWIVR
jgi:hypothetical protein